MSTSSEEWAVKAQTSKGEHAGRVITTRREAEASAERLRDIWRRGDAGQERIDSIQVVRRTRVSTVTEWEADIEPDGVMDPTFYADLAAHRRQQASS